ncbi:MAG: 2-oxo acid dehydrogenase subunit E2 [Treponema sp.]|nr:2-oxo acid dehydrogenase subunit E2 [Treponema sp.]
MRDEIEIRQNNVQKTIATTYKRRWGDRADGRRLKTLDPMANVATYLMATRSGSQNLFSDAVDIEKMNKYIHEKRNQGLPNFGAMHVLVGAYVRTISQKPGINRFVNGNRIYARNNIEVSMAVKKTLELNAPETMIKFIFEPNATIYEIYEQMTQKISEFQQSTDEQSAFDKLVYLLNYIPRPIMRGTVNLLKWLDYHGWIPRFLTLLSPFHGSLVITSMASLGINPVHHHLYNFGNVPVFIAFSATRHQKELTKTGDVVDKRYFDFTVSTDDRICDGHYYASAVKDIKKYLLNPQLLEVPPEKVIEDIR